MQEYVKSSELSKIMGMTQTYLAKLAKEGVLVKHGRNNYDLRLSIQGYIGFLKAQLPGNNARGDNIDLANASSELKKWQAIEKREKTDKGRQKLVEEMREQMLDEALMYFSNLRSGLSQLEIDNDSKSLIEKWLDSDLDKIDKLVDSNKEIKQDES